MRFVRFAPVLLALGGAAVWGGSAARAEESDLALFKRAMTGVWSQPAIRMETDLQVKATGGGATVTYHENLHLLASRSGKYRSQVTLINPDNNVGVVYRLHCDGRRVLTYRSGLRRYAVEPLSAFQSAGNDFPFLGLYTGSLFLADPSFKAIFSLITPESETASRQTLAGNQISLTAAPETLDGAEARVFLLNLGPHGYRYRFFVDPETADIRQIEMTGTTGHVTMQITERVLHLKPAAATAADFALSAPPYATRVPTLPVRPFYDTLP